MRTTIALHELLRGLYLVKMQLPDKPGEHYAILDIGNVLRHSAFLGAPTMYQLSRAGVVATPVTTALTVLLKVEDEALATRRFAQALTNPRYSVFANNCEHFARYVCLGVRESGQAQVLGVAAGLAAAAALVAIWPDGAA